MLRLTALLLILTAAGCTWEGRPDGAEANHSASDGYYDLEGAPQSTPLGGIATEAEIIEPLDSTPVSTEAPVGLSQPAPTTGTDDNTSEVEEALTPGTEQ